MAIKKNYDKCHVMHIDNNNLYFDYNLDMHNIIVSKCNKMLEFILMKNYRSKKFL